LAEVQQAAVDQIVIGHDVLPGPMPVQSVELRTPAHYLLTSAREHLRD